MAEIKKKLAKEELLRSGEGVEVEREDTPKHLHFNGSGDRGVSVSGAFDCAEELDD
jgi:hypothetical protein